MESGGESFSWFHAMKLLVFGIQHHHNQSIASSLSIQACIIIMFCWVSMGHVFLHVSSAFKKHCHPRRPRHRRHRHRHHHHNNNNDDNNNGNNNNNHHHHHHQRVWSLVIHCHNDHPQHHRHHQHATCSNAGSATASVCASDKAGTQSTQVFKWLYF